jgi:hypothetical protein
MRRHPALAPLSRDHHVALYVALRLRRAEPETASEARRALLAFWREGGGAAHFEAEEAVLLPAIEGHAQGPTIVAQHDDLRGRIAAIEDGDCPEPAVLHELGTRLTDHVRFEERELFPLLEQSLDEQTLVRVAAATEEYER